VKKLILLVYFFSLNSLPPDVPSAQVRQNTRLSFDMSRVAIGVVISHVQDLLTPGADPAGSDCLDGIVALCRNQMNAPRRALEGTYDARRLRVIFTEMTSCKEDSQQRSWMLHEDEPTIIEYIKEMSAILVSRRLDSCPCSCLRFCALAIFGWERLRRDLCKIVLHLAFPCLISPVCMPTLKT
jgi:hypothetical protein